MSTDISQPDIAQDRSTETNSPQLDNYTLEDRYLRDSGRVFLPDKWSSEEEFRIAPETAPVVIVVRSEMDRLLFTPVQPQTGI